MVKEILKMDDVIENPSEVVLIKNWKDEDRMVRGEVIPQDDTIFNLLKRKRQIQWISPEDLIRQILDDKDLCSVLYLCKEDFPRILTTRSAMEAYKMARAICLRENWRLDRWHIEAVLNSIELELAEGFL